MSSAMSRAVVYRSEARFDFGWFKIGDFSQGLYQSQVTQDNQTNSFTVTLAPSPQVLAVPPLQQTAYVIGGAIDYPGTGM